MFPLKQMFRHNNICIHITVKQMLRHNYRCSEMGARFWFCVPALLCSWHFRNAGARERRRPQVAAFGTNQNLPLPSIVP